MRICIRPRHERCQVEDQDSLQIGSVQLNEGWHVGIWVYPYPGFQIGRPPKNIVVTGAQERVIDYPFADIGVIYVKIIE